VEQKAIFLQHNHHSHRFDFVKLADGFARVDERMDQPAPAKNFGADLCCEGCASENA
jgi:hypothetical protein